PEHHATGAPLAAMAHARVRSVLDGELPEREAMARPTEARAAHVDDGDLGLIHHEEERGPLHVLRPGRTERGPGHLEGSSGTVPDLDALAAPREASPFERDGDVGVRRGTASRLLGHGAATFPLASVAEIE